MVHITRYHVVGLGIAIGLFGLVLWGVGSFGPPTVAEPGCAELEQLACQGEAINPDADWRGWSAVGSGFAVAWIGASYLVLRSRNGV